MSIGLFSTSVPLFLPCRLVHLYHFSRFHIYVLIKDICFSLSDLHHSVWQSLGPSTSLQMTQFRSFLWLSTIPLYICTKSSLPIRLLMGIYVASMTWLLWIVLQWTLECMCLFELWISLGICPVVGLLGHMVILFSVFWGTFILFSIVAVSIYIPTNSARGFPFLYTLSSICCL